MTPDSVAIAENLNSQSDVISFGNLLGFLLTSALIIFLYIKYSSYRLNKKSINKKIKFQIIIGLILLTPLLFNGYKYIVDVYVPMPTNSELIGVYRPSTWDWFADSPTLTLTENGNFSFNKPFLNQCLQGQYSYDSARSNDNALDFTCGEGYRMVGINKSIFGYEIFFRTNSESEGVTFEKIK